MSVWTYGLDASPAVCVSVCVFVAAVSVVMVEGRVSHPRDTLYLSPSDHRHQPGVAASVRDTTDGAACQVSSAREPHSTAMLLLCRVPCLKTPHTSHRLSWGAHFW